MKTEKPRHKSKKKIEKQLRQTKTFIFENFEECQLQNAVERWVLGIFECGFWGSTGKRVKKPSVTKWKFFSDLCPSSSDRFIKRNNEKLRRNLGIK